MAREWKARQIPSRTSITEVARRYHACAVALAQTLGLAVAEVLREHRESVTAVFIECGRSDLRLAANIQLPPLVAPEPQSHGDRGECADVTAVDHQPTSVPHDGQDGKARSAIAEHATGDTPLPTSLPSDGSLPCAGAEIATLKPAQLAMLVSKVATLAHTDAGWAPLLAALQKERSQRMAQGRRRS
jgi:hypothetical protein